MTLAGFALVFAVAWGVPVVAHLSKANCWIYLPSHFPALLAGLLGGPWAGAVAVSGTLLGEVSAPGPRGAVLAAISAEIAAYGMLAGALGAHAFSATQFLAALSGAMVGGRLVHWAVSRALGALSGAGEPAGLKDLFVRPWPGIALQLSLLPALAVWIRK